MKCNEFVEFLMDYLAGELGADARATFEEHLGLCPPCVDYLESYKETVRLGKLCEDDELPSDVPDRLVKAILAARKKDG